MTDHSDKALGRLPARHDDRTLRLARYLTPELPSPPARIDYAAAAGPFPMYGNDRYGDCFWAMTGNLIAATTAATGKKVRVSEDDVLSAYSGATGFRPSDPATDQGTVMLDGLNYWRKQGVGGHRIVAYAAVDPHNDREVEAAMTIFGGLAVGAWLPNTAQRQRKWTIGRGPQGAPGSWGGHAIPFLGYPARRGPYALPSWGELLSCSLGFVHRYCDEVYAVVTEDFINAEGMTPQGLNLQQMLDDLHAVTGPVS